MKKATPRKRPKKQATKSRKPDRAMKQDAATPTLGRADRKRIYEMRRDGASLETIAVHYAMSADAVSQVLAEPIM